MKYEKAIVPPLTDEEVAEIAKWHIRDADGDCEVCSEFDAEGNYNAVSWPCDYARLLADREALRLRVTELEGELTETQSVLAAHERNCDLIVLRPIRRAQPAGKEGE